MTDQPRRVGGLYRITRRDSSLDILVYTVLGPLMTYSSGKHYVRHEYLLAWGIDGEGRMVRRESWDNDEIKRFLRKVKGRGVRAASIWDSRSGRPAPAELRSQVRARQLDFG